MESWNQPWNQLQAGALILFYGRLAEVISPGSLFTPWVLEVTDEGGIVHSHTHSGHSNFELLDKAGECLLDGMSKAAAQPQSNEERRERIAEQWLADPRVGDMFRLLTGELLELVEIGEGEGIWAAFGFPPHKNTLKRAVVGMYFNGARELRNYLLRKASPVYTALAVATRRPEFHDHELIQHLESSPLWTGEIHLGPSRA